VIENQRLFLILALVFVLFLIWQAWMQEQAAKKGPVPAPTEAGRTVQPGLESPQRLDVPEVVVPRDATAAEPAQAGAQRVKVVTDVLEVELATTGGDVRYVGLRTYPKSLEQKDEPFALLQDSRSELFIAQSGLISETGSAPNHYAAFVPERMDYRLQDGQDSLEVPLTWTDGSGLKVVKTYTFHRGSFVIDLRHHVENASGQDWRGSQYRQLQRTPPEKTSGGLAGGIYTYTGGVISTPEKHYEKVSFDAMAKKDLSIQVKGGWIAMIQHYFLAAWIPEQTMIDNFYSRVVGGNHYILGMVGGQQDAPAGGATTFETQLYVGPKIQDRLEEVAPYLNLTVDYGILTIIAQPLFWLLKMIHKVTGNWGWAIIVLTVLIKAAFFKLSETSYRSMANMRRLAPLLTKLKDQYGDDRQKMNQAMMELYKKEKINPLGGCLPIVVQIPVFIALYWMLLESVELRQAPFLFWIQDLATKDPYYIFPIIMGMTMLVQQKLNPPPPDPIQAKVMMALPLVFTFFFLWFPAGLVLYWTVNNLLSIAQQYLITKRVEEAAART
jgi:YidC/Oxa1 family membrane protein insertase